MTEKIIHIDVGDMPPEQVPGCIRAVGHAYRRPGRVLEPKPVPRPAMVEHPLTLFGFVAAIVCVIVALLGSIFR